MHDRSYQAETEQRHSILVEAPLIQRLVSLPARLFSDRLKNADNFNAVGFSVWLLLRGAYSTPADRVTVPRGRRLERPTFPVEQEAR